MAYQISKIGFEPQVKISERDKLPYFKPNQGNAIYQFTYPNWVVNHDPLTAHRIFTANQIDNFQYGPVINGIQTFILNLTLLDPEREGLQDSQFDYHKLLILPFMTSKTSLQHINYQPDSESDQHLIIMDHWSHPLSTVSKITYSKFDIILGTTQKLKTIEQDRKTNETRVVEE